MPHAFVLREMSTLAHESVAANDVARKLAVELIDHHVSAQASPSKLPPLPSLGVYTELHTALRDAGHVQQVEQIVEFNAAWFARHEELLSTRTVVA